MPTNYIQNPDSSYSVVDTQSFDPAAISSQINLLKQQQAAAVELATNNAQAQFQPQIDALQAELDAFTQAYPAWNTPTPTN